MNKRGSSALCVGGFHAKQPATGSALFRSCRHCHLCLQGRNHEGGLRRHGPRSTRSRRGRVRVGNHIGRQRSPTTLPRTLQTSFQRGVCAPGYSSAPAVRTGDLVLMGLCALVAAGRVHCGPRSGGAMRTMLFRYRRPCALATASRRGYAHWSQQSVRIAPPGRPLQCARPDRTSPGSAHGLQVGGDVSGLRKGLGPRACPRFTNARLPHAAGTKPQVAGSRPPRSKHT